MSTWTVVGLLLTLIVVPLLVNEAGELAPWLAGRVVKLGASLLGTQQARERYAEEWAANLERVPGKVAKLAWACGLLLYSVPRLRIQIRSRGKGLPTASRAELELSLREQHMEDVRTACVKLLRAAVDLRAQVENNGYYHGPDTRERLTQVRTQAADVEVFAVEIAMLAPDVFADPADKLAWAASRLAVAAAASTDLDMNLSIEVPDFCDLDSRIKDFRGKAVAYAK
jgi:hypothetical protein